MVKRETTVLFSMKSYDWEIFFRGMITRAMIGQFEFAQFLEHFIKLHNIRLTSPPPPPPVRHARALSSFDAYSAALCYEFVRAMSLTLYKRKNLLLAQC